MDNFNVNKGKKSWHVTLIGIEPMTQCTGHPKPDLKMSSLLPTELLGHMCTLTLNLIVLDK